jgi:hypothetical protein
MAVEPWWDPNLSFLVGVIGGPLVGLWGSALGKGRGFVFGLLWAGAVVGMAGVVFAVAAVVGGQPYAIWYPLALCGGLLTMLSVPFLFITRHNYRQVELRKMEADELGA